MSVRGFSLVELLVALTVCALLAAAVAGVMAPSRAAFDATPAALDLQQRSRAGLDLVSSLIRSAGATTAAAETFGGLAAAMPTVMPIPIGDGFGGVIVVSVAPDAAQGEVARDQPGANGPLTLATSPCPLAEGVCGFQPDTTAVILDGRGRFEVMTVAAVSLARREVTPSAPLSEAYGAGAVLVAVDVSRFELRAQPDGSGSLARITGGGATQPIIDGVVAMEIEAWGEASAPRLAWDGLAAWASYGPKPPPPWFVDPQGTLADGETCVSAWDGDEPLTRLESFGEDGALVPITPADLEDGPWCPGGLDGPRYDADLFRLRRVDLSLRVEVLSSTLRGPAGRLFDRGGSAAHAPIRWVPDRVVKMSVALRNAR